MEKVKAISVGGISASIYSDYMLVIPPPNEVKEMIRKYKLSCAKVIGHYDGMHSIAHISVTGQHRQMPVTMGQKLDCYQRALIRLKPIELNINGFGNFMHGSSGATIYAKIEMNTEVNRWFEQLKRVFGDRKTIVPHITIAKNIPLYAFKALWPHFVNREYRERFVPDRLTTLTRPTFYTEGEFWRVFKELHFTKIV
ncbi:2'-5' RNA ligase family protein [uncultured Mucilaginibacter sp.]|uniref:2'-5' RNA ligase family protein n=1 Tax=uncultured Mucilaginibacter sp. TaxID=797541 RepID=UPI0025CCBE4C|nr:2'-5' RNA ligase family protein [uncultured Mucilaginibacter sp.]